MKTLIKFKQESFQFYAENAATYFAAEFSKKMGGTQNITFEDNFLPPLKIDRREFYQGRGAKYNSASMHEHIDVFVTKNAFDKKVLNRAKSLFNQQKEHIALRKQLRQFCQMHGLTPKNYTQKGSTGVYFSPAAKAAIEAELNVDLTDFLNASGKTYFFANSKIGLLLFYHNHRQSFSFDFTSITRQNEFHANRESWISAPYAGILGQTNNENLFVC